MNVKNFILLSIFKRHFFSTIENNYHNITTIWKITIFFDKVKIKINLLYIDFTLFVFLPQNHQGEAVCKITKEVLLLLLLLLLLFIWPQQIQVHQKVQQKLNEKQRTNQNNNE